MTNDDHNHGPWIAHHFDNPRQQFDAGKLGIWVFLVTEILFFSGLFCAYVLYRAAQPEVFYEAHFHLDKILGGLNTIVLLFSSLTMAIAVRAAQLNQNKTLIINLILTMICASIFLGVKAVEYSHKWDEGILTRGYYDFQHQTHEAWHISPYLKMISILPLILLVGFSAGAALFKVTNDAKKALFFFGLALMMGGYFLGAIAGQVYMEIKPKDDSHQTHHEDDHAHDGEAGKSHDDEHSGDEHSGDDKKANEDASDKHASHSSATGLTEVAYRTGRTGAIDEPKEGDTASTQGESTEEAPANPADAVPLEEKKRRVGIFFSIYYCMTGLHAIHVIAGMIALSWLLWRAVQCHFRQDYFGPVDYVGLYWHLVDLIWIYLFPLLYLIN